MTEPEKKPNQHLIWADREARWLYRLALARNWKLPVGTLTLNIPGVEKNPPGAAAAVLQLGQHWRQSLTVAGLPIVHAEQHEGADGLALHLVVRGSALQVKQCAIAVENLQPLGRLADADVLDADGNPIGREQLGLAPRPCLLCDRPAVLCMREGRHPQEDIARAVRNLLERTTSSSGMAAR